MGLRFTDVGILLNRQTYGESKVILSFFTQKKGLVKGVFHITKRTNKGLVFLGNRVACSWSARLESHLGTWKLEIIKDRAHAILTEPTLLAAINYLGSFLHRLLPEQHPYDRFFASVNVLLDKVSSETVYQGLIFFELTLLREMGFGLNTQECAVTGQTENLVWLSPKTARSVSREAGMPYKNSLFLLPEALKQVTVCYDFDEFLKVYLTPKDIQDIARITGYFIERFFSDIPNLKEILSLREDVFKKVG